MIRTIDARIARWMKVAAVRVIREIFSALRYRYRRTSALGEDARDCSPDTAMRYCDFEHRYS
jgi:hypothetical protein